MDLEKELDHREGIFLNLEGIASIAAALSDYEQAARLFATREALRADLGIPLPQVDASDLEMWKKTARDKLGEEANKSAQAEVRTLSSEHAIELAKK